MNQKPQQQTMEEFLKEYKELKIRLSILKDERESLQATGKSIFMQGGFGSKDNDKSQTDDDIFLLEKRIKIIDDTLASLPELQRRIIECMVIDGEPYIIVCAELYISDGGARKLKKKALKTLERIMSRS